MVAAPGPAGARRRHDTGRALVVELCGLPGSGKTTLAGALVTTLAARGLAVAVVDARVSAAVPTTVRLRRKVVLGASGLAADPRQVLAETTVLGRAQRGRDRLAVPAQWVLTRTLVARAMRTPTIGVLEEGLVQALWTAGLGPYAASGDPAASPGEQLVHVARHAARPDLVVHLDVPVDVAVDRLRRRASRHSRVQRIASADQLKVLHAGERLLDDLLAAWTRRGLGDVLVLDDGADPVETLGRVVTERVGRRAGGADQGPGVPGP